MSIAKNGAASAEQTMAVLATRWAQRTEPLALQEPSKFLRYARTHNWIPREQRIDAAAFQAVLEEKYPDAVLFRKQPAHMFAEPRGLRCTPTLDLSGPFALYIDTFHLTRFQVKKSLNSTIDFLARVYWASRHIYRMLLCWSSLLHSVGQLSVSKT